MESVCIFCYKPTPNRSQVYNLIHPQFFDNVGDYLHQKQKCSTNSCSKQNLINFESWRTLKVDSVPCSECSGFEHKFVDTFQKYLNIQNQLRTMLLGFVNVLHNADNPVCSIRAYQQYSREQFKEALGTLKNSGTGFKANVNLERVVVKHFQQNDNVSCAKQPDIVKQNVNSKNVKEVEQAALDFEHPLLNAVVLQNLLKYITSFQERKVIRQVCKNWYSGCLKDWRDRAIIKIGPTNVDQSKMLENTNKSNNAWDIENYLEAFKIQNDFRALAKFPYSSYILQEILFRSNTTPHAITWYEVGQFPETSSFWTHVGPKMKILHFKNCVFQSEQIFEHAFTQTLYNLEKLQFSECQTFPQRTKNFFFDGRPVTPQVYQACTRRNHSLRKLKIIGVLPSDLSFLLFNAPNIQRIELDGKHTPFRNYKAYLNFYPSLSKTCYVKELVDKQTFSIKDMQINLNYENFMPLTAEDALNIQSRMKFSLETLFYVSPRKYSCNSIHNILQPLVNNASSSLRVLKALRPFVTSFGSSLPEFVLSNEMVALEEIYFYGSIHQNLNFLAYCSNLKVLYIDYKFYDSLEVLNEMYPTSKHALPEPNQPHKAWPIHVNILLGKLVRLHLDKPGDPRFWERCSRWMPNLRVLEAILNNAEFQAVCRWMPNLEELTILHESSVDDNAITGLNGTTARHLRERNLNNLTCLVDLKRFVMKQKCGKYSPARSYFKEKQLGNLAVFSGFLELHNLEEVVVYASRKMTEAGELALRNHVAKVEVIRAYGPTPHGNGKCCEVKKFIQTFKLTNELEYS